VVLKPSERAPLVPIALFEAAQRAGVPPGVLNMVHGRADVAAALCSDPRVDLVTITGGTRSGTAVMQAAAPTIKNLILELGGKSAHIILADADLDMAIPAAAAGIYRNSGQRCFSGSRLVVEEAVADRVAEGVSRIADALVVGDPFEPDTQVGALIDGAALDSVESFVARARADGLTIAAGGRRVRELEPGFFYRPTLLTGARADSHAAQEEVFGPVLTMIRVKDLDEAVAVANNSRYGLAGGVWTRNLDRALEVARRVRCGYFWINTYGAIFGDVPFGGYGQSGFGREGGREGYDAYTELKTVLIDTTGGTTAPLFDFKG
jgi:aldehyde dehydrogenase (NAD+)